MLKKLFLLAFVLFLSLSLTLPVAAFQAEVTNIKGSILTLKNLSQMPPWVKKGALAKTSRGLAKVKMVDGDLLNIKIKSSTAKKMSPGDTIEVKPKNADPSEMLQGC